MRRNALTILQLIVAAMTLLTATHSFADLLQTTSHGISWLIQSKLGNEYWGRTIPAYTEIEELSSEAVSPTALRDTIEATKTLSIYEPSLADYQMALSWLAEENAESTESLARKISVLAPAGKDVSTDLVKLISYQRGGFGGYKNTPCNSLDTALALQALKAANYSDTTVLYQAINFLTTNQHSDGGWAFVSGGPSNAYVTAIALRTLSNFSAQFSVQSSIQSASAYLLTKQNTDGGFGSSPSNVYETALSVMALIESGQGTAQTLQNGINYLTNTQSPNGSWNDDPYSTALALQALANVRPNLQLSSISLSKSMPREGEDVTITALIANNSLEDATGVVVRFYLGDPSTGSGQVPATGVVQIGTDQILPLIAIGSSAQASITTNFASSGAKTVYVVVDPDNLIA